MLTDTLIRNAKPGEKPLKRFDGKGLFLLVNKTGSKLWRWKYRFEGKKSDVVERQLAHEERNQIRAAYNRAEYLEERRELMQS